MFSNQLFNYCKFVGILISKEREILNAVINNYFKNTQLFFSVLNLIFLTCDL